MFKKLSDVLWVNTDAVQLVELNMSDIGNRYRLVFAGNTKRSYHEDSPEGKAIKAWVSRRRRGSGSEE